MLFKQYKIVYWVRNNSEDTNTDLELMTFQTSQGSSYGLVLSRWSAWKISSLDNSNTIYKMFLLEMVLDTDNNTVDTQVMDVYTKPIIPKVEIKYNHFDTPVATKKSIAQLLDEEEPYYEEESSHDN